MKCGQRIVKFEQRKDNDLYASIIFCFVFFLIKLYIFRQERIKRLHGGDFNIEKEIKMKFNFVEKYFFCFKNFLIFATSIYK